MSSLKMSVVIPTINMNYDPKSIIRSGTVSNISLDIIVVKQASPNKEVVHVEYFEACRITTIVINEFGLSHARNVGLSNASGDVVVFLDDDVVPASGYLTSLVNLYSSASVDLAFGKVNYVDLETIEVNDSRKYLYHNVVSKYRATGAGSTLSVRRTSAIKNRLLFNEKIGAGKNIICGEDSVYCLQAFKKGLGVFQTQHAVVHHPIEGSTMHLRSDAYFRSYWVVMKTFYGAYGLALGIKFSMRILLKERDALSWVRFWRAYVNTSKLAYND